MIREYPPHVYGGAGVHVEYLAREVAIELYSHAAGMLRSFSYAAQTKRAESILQAGESPSSPGIWRMRGSCCRPSYWTRPFANLHMSSTTVPTVCTSPSRVSCS